MERGEWLGELSFLIAFLAGRTDGRGEPTTGRDSSQVGGSRRTIRRTQSASTSHACESAMSRLSVCTVFTKDV